ncbi:MAG: phenol degradation protein meta [Bradyrhizobiaceae bacterium]|nr:MAG: phenol degradation protein meta [Bradyrhizobiaceae bacterium]
MQRVTRHQARERKGRRVIALISSVIAIPCLLMNSARADESGISFWLPGLNGSLAAAPAVPGWSWATLYYHTSVDASRSAKFTDGGSVVAGLRGQADLGIFGPTYTFATPVLGAQAAVSVLGIAGRSQASIDATLTGPMGGSISGSRTDTVTGFGDIVPQVSLKWNNGVNNFMWYGAGGIPVGAYQEGRLANVGIGHGAIDSGFGYTYFNPQSGNEFSAVLGATYNFKNTYTQYQNGIDLHLDLGASHFVTKQWMVGLVGYYFQQLTADSGQGAVLGDFKSRVAGIGPQIGYLFPINGMQGYINVKGYKEFAAENRPEGWNLWLTFQISPAAPEPGSPARQLVTK